MNFEVKVIKGDKLIAKDVTGSSDSFVKAFLVDMAGKVPKKEDKTYESVSKVITSLNPEWNWLAFTITSGDIATQHLKYVYFSVWDEDVTTEEFMGKAKLSIKKIKDTPIGQTIRHELVLLSRDGRKDKVKGSITVEVKNVRSNSFAKSESQISRRGNRMSVNSMIGARGVSNNNIVVPHIAQNFIPLPPYDFMRSDDEFSSVRALWFTSFAQLAYKNYPIAMHILQNLWGMKTVKYFEHFETDTQGIGAYNDRLLVIAFRGTESFDDFLIDLKLLPVSPFPNKKSLKVHKGFNLAFTGVRNQVEKFVKNALKENKDLKVYICGHSLGGALATLCGAYFKIFEEIKVNAIYTIGQPKVGNRAFGDHLKEFIPLFRIINQTDPIPFFGYGSHFGREVYINTKGHIKEQVFMGSKQLDRARGHLNAISNKNLASFLNNHTSGQYRKWVEIYLQRDIAPNLQRDYVYISTVECHERVGQIMESFHKCRHFRSFFGPIPNDLHNLKLYFKEITPEASGKLDLLQQTELESLIASFSMNLELLAWKAKEYSTKSTVFSPIEVHVEFTKFLYKFAHGIKFLVTQLVKKITPKAAYDLSFTRFSAIYQHFTSSPIYNCSILLEVVHILIDEKKFAAAQQKISDPALCTPPIEEFDALINLFQAKINFGLGNIEASSEYLLRIAHSPALVEIAAKLKRMKEMEKDPQISSIIIEIKSTARLFRKNKKKLNKEEIQKLTNLFDAADDNGDRYLTANELEQYISNQGISNILIAIGTRLPSHINAEYYFQSIVDDIKQRSQQRVGLDEFLSIMSEVLQLDSSDDLRDSSDNVDE